MNFFENSVFFGVTISLIAYGFGHALQGKFKLAILNPLLISVASIIALLAVTHIDYKAYYSGAQYLSYLLTPATVCLAIPLYEQFEAAEEKSGRCHMWNLLRSFCILMFHSCNGCILRLIPQRIHYIPSEVYYNSNWHWCIRRAWRICDINGCRNYPDRYSR